MSFETTREAVTKVAEESPEASGLLAALMATNADHLASLQTSLYEGMEADRDRWRERAIEAETRLLRAQDRILELFS